MMRVETDVMKTPGRWYKAGSQASLHGCQQHAHAAGQPLCLGFADLLPQSPELPNSLLVALRVVEHFH
jgi:hypothetical protein